MTQTSMMFLNMKLYSLLNKTELVEKWWNTPNKAFDNRTPKSVYISDTDGPEKIEAYIDSFHGGDYS